MKKIVLAIIALILIAGIVAFVIYNNSKNLNQGARANPPAGTGTSGTATDLNSLSFDSSTGQTNDTAVTFDAIVVDSSRLS